MREARIILPVVGNNGEDISQAHEALEVELAQCFGGYTVYEGRGGWVTPEGDLQREDVRIYDVAMSGDNGSGYWSNLENIAMRTKLRAGQRSIYVRGPDGVVRFV